MNECAADSYENGPTAGLPQSQQVQIKRHPHVSTFPRAHKRRTSQMRGVARGWQGTAGLCWSGLTIKRLSLAGAFNNSEPIGFRGSTCPAAAGPVLRCPEASATTGGPCRQWPVGCAGPELIIGCHRVRAVGRPFQAGRSTGAGPLVPFAR